MMIAKYNGQKRTSNDVHNKTKCCELRCSTSGTDRVTLVINPVTPI